MAGKNMNYFLMDSTPNGRIKCTLANWTGVAYKIPRVKLVDCKNIDYLKQSGDISFSVKVMATNL